MTVPHPDPVQQAATVLDDIAEHAEALAFRRRRLLRALRDLGLLDALGGAAAIGIGADGFELAELTSRQSDQLTRRCEDLAEILTGLGALNPPANPGPGQLPLFD